MKKLLILFIAVLLSQVSFGQYNIIQNIGSPSTLVQVPANGGLKALFVNRPFNDTTEANATNIKYYAGAQIFTQSDSLIWVRGTGATKWIQLVSNSTGGGSDTLVWKLSGNTIGGRVAEPVLGTWDSHPINFITEGQQRMIIPSAGITRNGAAVNKYLLLDTITHNLYYGDGGSSGVPTLQEVLDAGSVLNKTNTIYISDHDTLNIIPVGNGSTYEGQVIRMTSPFHDGRIYLNDDSSFVNHWHGQLKLRAEDDAGNSVYYLNARDENGNNSGLEGSFGSLSVGSTSTNNLLSFNFDVGSTNFTPFLGQIYIDSLNSGAATDSILTWNKTGGMVRKRPVSDVVTNIYNSDGTLTGNRTLTGAGHNLNFEGNGGGNEVVWQDWDSYSWISTASAGKQSEININANYAELVSSNSISPGFDSKIIVTKDTISVKPHLGLLVVDSLTQGDGADSLLSWQPSTGLVRKIDPARIAGNTIYTGDGTLAGNRTIDANNNNLIIDSTNTFTSTGRYFNFQAANTLGVSTIYNYIEELNRNNLLIRNFTGVDTSDILFDGYQGVSVSSTTAAYLSANRNADGSRSFAYVLPDSLKLYGDKGLSFYTGNGSAAQNRMVIDASGNVGINTTPGTTTLSVAGSLALGYVEKTTTYVVAASDYTINCTSGTFTVTLPTAVGITGRVYVIKNTGAGTVTIDGDGTETIDGSLTQVLNIQYASLTVQSTGTGWIIL